MRTFKIYSFSNFKIRSTVLAVVTVLCVASPRLTDFIAESLCLSAPSPISSNPHPWQQDFFLFHWFSEVSETAKDLGRLYNRCWCICHCGFLFSGFPLPPPVFQLLWQCQTLCGPDLRSGQTAALCLSWSWHSVDPGERPQPEGLYPQMSALKVLFFPRTSFPPVVPAFCCSSGPSNSCWGAVFFLYFVQVLSFTCMQKLARYKWLSH